jgi:hypothetical protein
MPDNNKNSKEVDITSIDVSKVTLHESNITDQGKFGAVAAQFGNTDFGDSKYDNDALPSEYIHNGAYNELRALEQSSLAKLGSGVVNAVTHTGLDIIKDASYLLDFENYSDFTKSSEEGFSNWLGDAVQSLEDKLKLPVYRTKASEGFSPLSAGWWGDNIPSITSTIAMMFPAEAAVMGLSKLGKAMGGAKIIKGIEAATGATKLGNTLEGVTGAVLSRQMENIMEGSQTFNEVKQKALEAGKTEQEANKIAGEAAANNYKANWVNLATDLPQYMLLHKSFKNSITDMKLKTSDILKTVAQEGGEEAYQFISNEEAKRAALVKSGVLEDDKSTLTDRLLDYAKDGDLWTAAFLGGLGGGVFGGIAAYNNSRNAPKLQAQYEALTKMHTALLKGDEESFNRTSDDLFTKELVSNIKYGTTDQFKSMLNQTLDLAEDRTQLSEAKQRIKERESIIDFATDYRDKIANDPSKSSVVKAAELEAAVNQKVVSERLKSINNKFSRVTAEDHSNLGLVDPTVYQLKIAKLNLEAIKDIPQFSTKAAELSKVVEQGYKDVIENSNGLYKSVEDINKSLVSPQDAEIVSLLKNRELDTELLNKTKDLLYKTSTKEGKEAIEKEVAIQAKRDAEAKAAEVKQAEVTKTVTTPTPTEDVTDLGDDLDAAILGRKESNDNTAKINKFVDRMQAGETMEDPFDLQFYTNNKEAIEKRLQDLKTAPTPEVTDTDISANQEMVSSQLTSKNIENEEDQTSGDALGQSVELYQAERSINARNNTVMMRLFQHAFKKGRDFVQFVFLRNEDGLPALDNNSGLDINEINNVKVGDKITLSLVTLSPEQAASYEETKAKSLKDPDVKPTDFDDKHIGISSNGKLIGFIQQPHAIAKDSKDYKNSVAVREGLMIYRKAVLDKLAKGEVVTETVSEKGAGNLYTRINEDGTINDQYSPFVQARKNEDGSLKDAINGHLVFVYSNGEDLLLDNANMSEDDEASIRERLTHFKNYGKAGKVYQLVKDSADNWTPLPVYANDINREVAKEIVKTLATFDNRSNPKEIVAALNDYIYASSSRTHAHLAVRSEDGVVTLRINGNKYTLDNIVNSKEERGAFVKDLMAMPQNIAINKLNNTAFQESLATRNTLTTNVTTFHGEFFIQPYIGYSQTAVKDLVAKENKVADEKVDGITDADKKAIDDYLSKYDTDSPIEDAFSKKVDLTKLDRSAFKKWLTKNLPQLSVSDISRLQELKDNAVDSFGLYRDMTIYLFEGAGSKTAFHEAFHGVFRNLVSLQERHDILREASKKFIEPTLDELSELQHGLTRNYSNDELRYIYYEEKLADDFADYSFTYNNRTLGQKILDFFNKILDFFKIFSKNDNNRLEELYNSINRGKLAKVDPSISRGITNRSFEAIDSEYAYSRELNRLVGPSNKARITEAMGNAFMSQFKENMLKGVDKRPSLVYADILDQYKSFLATNDSNPKVPNRDKQIAAMVIAHFGDFIVETNKYLSYRNVRINEKIEFDKVTKNIVISEGAGNIEFEGGINEDNLEGLDAKTEEVGLGSQSTKGFGEWTSISGLSSASVRLKLFLSSVPILDKDNKPKKDVYGFTQYYDFSDLYYYIERNMIDKYTLEDQLATLVKLSDTRPEMKQVLGMLQYDVVNRKAVSMPSSNLSTEQLTLLRNDFKTNFSKQQLVYTLVKFDTNSSTGKVTSFRIMEANRQSVGNEVFNEWSKNVLDISRTTIAENKDTEEVKLFGTKMAKDLQTQWSTLAKRGTPIPLSIANGILNKVGIEYAPEVLQALLVKNSGTFKNAVQKVLDWYASDRPTDVEEKSGRMALRDLVSYEVDSRFDRYTSSFIDGENKNIYTIQLPSYAAKLLAQLRNPTTSASAISEMQKDPFYKYSNILNGLNTDPQFQKEFKLSYLDSLKDEKGESLGSKFTSMGPRDFMSMEIALFQNTAINTQKENKLPVGKYVYITPSDKTMSMIFDSRIYRVLRASKDHIDTDRSEIVDKFYNVFLSEAARIKGALNVKEDIINNRGKGQYQLTDLLEHYHVASKDKAKSWSTLNKLIKVSKTRELTDEEWNTISTLFTGNAFKFKYFSIGFNNEMNNMAAPIIRNSSFETLESNLNELKPQIREMIGTYLSSEYKRVLDEAVEKGIITLDKTSNLYASNTIVLGTKTKEAQSEEILDIMASYALNHFLHNIELSNLLNGDFALYKPNDLQKRTYQSQSMTTSNNFEQTAIKTLVVKDYEVGSEQYETVMSALTSRLGFTESAAEAIAGKYQAGINVTDAQVYTTPKFYRNIHIARGTWNDEMQAAYDVIEGKTELKDLSEKQRDAVRTLLGGIKPYYFGKRFDTKLGIQRYEQVKCAMLPLFKMYTDMNPLMAEKAAMMRKQGIDMIAHESSFKATIGYREDITSNDGVVLSLDPKNFGIQVDNPNHIEDGNDSMRQLKMLIIGSIDPHKTYKGIDGRRLIDTIMSMEATNIKESYENLIRRMDVKNNLNFADFIKDMVTKRGATINVEEALSVLNGDFEYSLDSGNLSRQVENMISSLFTNNVIKQLFEVGGSAVQATSLGVQYKNLAEQQEGLTHEAKLLQQSLTWIKPNVETGDIGYAECIMPAWSKKFFNEDGTVKDMKSIPEALREIVAYRIPTEGLHSMMPIKVVAFLPETMGNFILLPYEVTTQFGADFDFDKIYFIGREFSTLRDGKLIPYTYSEETTLDAIKERWKQYKRYAKEHPKDNSIDNFEEFMNLRIERQNPRGARNNKIIDTYLHLLTSIENLHLIVSPSGFTDLENAKAKYFDEGRDAYEAPNFFSSRTQRDYKQRNHTGIALKGQWALHVTGHAYGALMDLTTRRLDSKGGVDMTKSINFNGEARTEFNKLYTDNGKLITDEVSQVMAGVLDDIKNPLLSLLGIDKNTTDVLATIIRAGYDLKTALLFGMQPSIKHLSRLLTSNEEKLEGGKRTRHNVNNLIATYTETHKELVEKYSKIDGNKLDNPNFEDNYVSILDKVYDSLREEEMDEWIKRVQDPKDIKGLNLEDKIKYYSVQIRALKQFAIIKPISDELVTINKFFSINKEVGPNIEDIITKQELYKDIMSSKIMNGFNIDRIPSLAATWKIHEGALRWFESYFPYSTSEYLNIKKTLSNIQFNKSLAKMKVENRIYMNNFIRTYTDYFSKQFSGTQDRYLELLHNTPSLLKNIKNASNKEKTLGAMTYDDIRNNAFIKELKVDYDQVNKFWTIRLKGNRLDLQVKNNVIEAFKSLYKNPSTKELATNLIEHSFLTTGFFTGVSSYASLIGPDVLKELGYNEHRKDLVRRLKNNDINSQDSVSLQDELPNIIDQMIRNNPKAFTKSFDGDMFNEYVEGKPLPETLTTTEELIDNKGRRDEMIFDFEDYISSPSYIRLYDATRMQTVLYKVDAEDPFRYHYIAKLGKNGSVIEIDPTMNLPKSRIRENNLFGKTEVASARARKAAAEQSNDEVESYMDDMESPAYDDTPIQDIDDIEASVLGRKTDDDTSPKKNKYDMGDDLPDDITKC